MTWAPHRTEFLGAVRHMLCIAPALMFLVQFNPFLRSHLHQSHRAGSRPSQGPERPARHRPAGQVLQQPAVPGAYERACRATRIGSSGVHARACPVPPPCRNMPSSCAHRAPAHNKQLVLTVYRYCQIAGHVYCHLASSGLDKRFALRMRLPSQQPPAAACMYGTCGLWATNLCTRAHWPRCAHDTRLTPHP